MIKQFPDSANLPNNIFARFIMGYAYDLTEATNRFTPYFAWSKQTNIMNLRPEDFPQINNAKPFRVIGRTKLGHAVILLQMKNLKIKEAPSDDFSKFIGSVIFKALSEANQSLDSYYMIIDIKDYSKENFDMDGLKKLMPIFSNYFPDVLFKMTIVNLGFFAANLFSLLSMFMHEVTKKKIRHVKENITQIKELLSEDIEDDNIPKVYGGSSSVQVA
jgi:hypothetical protein